MRRRGPGQAVRVLESLDRVKPTTNPYLTQLIAALEHHPGVDVRLFSFRRAILGRYDVFHVHWPELTFGGHKRVGRLVRRTLTTLLLVRLSLSRTPIVRTLHNVVRPSGLGRWDRALLDAIDRRTTVAIRLNEHTEQSPADRTVTILHGHYRDWVAPLREPRRPRPRRVLYFGLIRPYKGVEELLAALASRPDLDVELRVVGSPADAALARAVRTAAESDPRITHTLRYVDERTLVEEISAASLVVLPYRAMHNSGALLFALSLDAPVLVPDSPVTRSLAAEVGGRWVHTYDGSVTAAAIADALRQVSPEVAGTTDGARPDLRRRTWAATADAHAAAFALALKRPSGGSGSAWASTTDAVRRDGSAPRAAREHVR